MLNEFRPRILDSEHMNLMSSYPNSNGYEELKGTVPWAQVIGVWINPRPVGDIEGKGEGLVKTDGFFLNFPP